MAADLKLGLNTGYWAGGPPPGITEAIAEAERLGLFDEAAVAAVLDANGRRPGRGRLLAAPHTAPPRPSSTERRLTGEPGTVTRELLALLNAV